MAIKRKRRVLLQVDFGGPLVNDAVIERTRARTALRTARESGLHSALISNAGKNPGLAKAIASVSTKEFMNAYSGGKAGLKAVSKGAEAYSDVNRTAAALLEAAKAKNPGLVSDLSYNDLTEGIGKRIIGDFFRKFSRPVKAAAKRSFDSNTFATLSKIIRGAKARGIRLNVDIISDNNPLLFRKAFQPAIRAEAKAVAGELGVRMPVSRYRKNPKTVAGRAIRQMTLLLSPKGKSRIYISGESWGNKNDPETWKRILKDRKVRKGESVVFVDDGLKKLEGFYSGASAYGARPVAVWLDLKKEKPVSLIGITENGFPHLTIHSIGQIENIIEKL